MDGFIEEHEVNGSLEKWVIITPNLDSEDENVSSEEEDSDDDTPLADLIPLSDLMPLSDIAATSAAENSAKQHVYRWGKRAPPVKERIFKGDETLTGFEEMENPIDFFHLFFDKEMINLIAEQTNLYSTQCNLNKGSIGVSSQEIKNFIGILLKMCIVQMPRYRMYWENCTRYDNVAKVMSRNRFEEIKRFLHFVDNSTRPLQGSPDTDKLFKIRPLFEKLRKNCLQIKPEEHNSIDEQMIPFKGRSNLRRYLPKKPKKWGFKLFSRNGQSGFCYDFDMEGAPNPNAPSIESCGYVAGDMVLKLASTLPEGQNYKLYFDNYFNFLELLLRLKESKF